MKKIRILKVTSIKFSQSAFYIAWFNVRNKKLIKINVINELHKYKK